MKRLWTTLILSILFSRVSAKFYVPELSDDVKSIRDYNDALNLLKSIVPSRVSAKFYVPELSDDVKSIRDYNDALNLLKSIVPSRVSAKFYVPELSDDVKSIRDYNDALNLLKSIVPVSESNERSENSVEIPIEWDSDISSILRRRAEKKCYQKKHLSTVCIQACVEAIDLGCHESWCENKHKMKEFCNLPCKLTYNQYRF